MIELLGNLGLCGAVLAAAGSILCAVAAVRFNSIKLLRSARWTLALLTLFFLGVAALLLTALLQSDFRFAYVASYTERALPVGYKFAALWAGQEGSLLLWACLLSIMCLTAVFTQRRSIEREDSIAAAVMATVCGFFAVLLLFTANPFEVVPGGAPPDGRGLNPQLQDPGMIIHPPLLFIGYAGFTIPFAMMLGVLIAGRSDNHWLGRIRPWTLISWLFLGAGIVVGAWWAYIELGWGGYWAWDPVENASLLPWLTSTALLHSIIAQQRRGTFKIWNASLIALTFTLCIFGTYLTRSGVIDSVHAFASSLLGRFFLVFLLLCISGSSAMIIWRLPMLRSEHKLEALISREGAFLAGNVLLMIMMLTTLVGTIFPLISGIFIDQPVTVKPPFYNKVVAPMGILLVGLMALGPVLAFGVSTADRLVRSVAVPIAFGIAASITTTLLITSNIWVLVCVFITILGTVAVIIDFGRSWTARRRSTGENWIISAVRLVDKDHRRYGGQLAHLGVMVVVIGVVGSSLFSTETVHRLRPGDAVTLQGVTIELLELEEVAHTNYIAVQANLRLTGADGRTQTIHPQRRFYAAWADQPSSEIALCSTWREDLYVSLAGWEDGGRMVALQVKVNPLVLWIWIGAMVLTAGGLLCLLPRFMPQVTTVIEEPAAEKKAAAIDFEPVLTGSALRAEGIA